MERVSAKNTTSFKHGRRRERMKGRERTNLLLQLITYAVSEETL